MTVKKARYKVDIAELHALCEANYARFLQIFPGYESSNVRELTVGGARVCLEVIERSRFTTSFRLKQTHSERWLGALSLELRAYHDARMLEVVGFQAQRSIAARYAYPNEHMHQQDEKVRQNHFFYEWLSWCMQQGHLTRSTAPQPEA